MMARLRVSLPIAIVTALVGLFITRVLVPDPSALVVSIVAVAAILTVVVLSVLIQKRQGLRGHARHD